MQKRTLSSILFSLFIICVSTQTFASPPFDIKPTDVSQARKAFYYVKRGDKDSAFYHAEKTSDPLIRALVQWAYYVDGGKSVGFAEIKKFIETYPTWPQMDKIKRRAESAMPFSTAPNQVVAWLTQFPPQTPRGKWLLANAYEAQAPSDLHRTIAALVHDAWVDGNWNAEDEAMFLKQHGNKLTEDDHIARLDRMVWDEQFTSLHKQAPRVNAAYRQLVEARVKLLRNQGSSDAAVASVPKKYKNDPSLLYARVMWNERKKRSDQVQKLLTDLPSSLPHSEEWWSPIVKHTRRLIEEKKYAAAYQLISHHGQTKPENIADAEWLAGWIALRFLYDPATAESHFTRMYQEVSFPISQSRAAYWAGRAFSDQNKKEKAQEWYKKATRFPTAFYGQLAHYELSPNAPLSFEEYPEPTKAERDRYKRNALVRIAYYLVSLEEDAKAKLFLKAALKENIPQGEKALISYFGLTINKPSLAIAAASEAYKQGLIFSSGFYPVLGGLPKLSAPTNLVHSIIRQESHFTQDAQSSAGAMGLMQLIPSTARHMSQQLGVSYNSRKLTADPLYNVTLGSAYIGQLLKEFNGSHILAIASYNAGPGNAMRWTKEYGDPRKLKNLHQVVDWIESIPFSETRNYVQRVLEAKQVYEMRLNKRPIHAGRLVADLVMEPKDVKITSLSEN
ncbi:MAG: hypothetical protein K0R63_266 [Rickettsiales bacterium]|jgi:soluble lytic murein transglycosylase|nr:hypothetical protein [Rickettsiales bacterium]